MRTAALLKEALFISAATILLVLPAAAQTEAVIFSFQSGHKNGTTPLSHLVDFEGTLYGTAEKGGAGKFGAVFKLTNSNGAWKETLLHSFQGKADGAYPGAGLIRDSSGALYGSTERGGSKDEGTAFKLSNTGNGWSEEVLHSFTGGSNDGSHPYAELTLDPTSGNLYGMTYNGGASNCGVVYQLALANGIWTETILHTFGGSDGCNPGHTAIKEDSLGNLYGVTVSGGASGFGAAFMLTSDNGVWSQTVLHSFEGNSDGAYGSAVDITPSGILYGATSAGGIDGAGTIFQLAQSGGKWNETILYNFAGTPDGSSPYGMNYDHTTGVLYGTTELGGAQNKGTVFQLAPNGNSWKETVLHSFGGKPDGALPEAGISEDKTTGVFYGTTSEGGTGNEGSVFSLTQ